MQSNLDGRAIQPFFNHMDDCSCPYRPSVIPVMTIDSTNFQKPVMYWISLEGHLNIADIDGCACSLIVNAGFNKGLPPTSLTADKMNIYWSNIAEDQIYFVNKKYPDDEEIKHFYLPSVRSIKALGKSLQTYPITNCLIPHQVSYNVEEVSKTANSITVKLPQPVPQFGCEGYSLPTTLYTIYVSQCLENDPNMCEDSDRTKFQTYEKEYEIKDLKPFTKYRLKLALSNYYADLESMSLEFGSGVVLRTEAGAPTPPENVTVEALTPTLAIVYWMPPKILNAAAVRYEVHWRLFRLINGARQKGEQVVKGTERTADGRFFTILEPWLPDQEYVVFVRAYPAHVNDVYSESPGQVVKMYPEPNNLTLDRVSVNSLNVSWVPTVNPMVRYTLEYKDVAVENWQVANDFKVDKEKVTYFIDKLQPRTLYKFHLLLRYPNYKKDFVWPTDGGYTFQTLGNELVTVLKLRPEFLASLSYCLESFAKQVMCQVPRECLQRPSFVIPSTS